MAISDHYPPLGYLRGGKTVVPYNIVEQQVVDPQTGITRIQYAYDEAEGETAADAQRVAGARVAAQLADIAGMSYAELDTYIENNATSLATNKGA